MKPYAPTLADHARRLGLSEDELRLALKIWAATRHVSSYSSGVGLTLRRHFDQIRRLKAAGIVKIVSISEPDENGMVHVHCAATSALKVEIEFQK